MRIDRMLSITILLLSRDRVSAKELANRFEVSVRTIYRDMEAINVAGIPIISYSGTDGGFGIMDGFKLDRQIFTTQDMVSILSPLEGINKALNSEAITQVIDKIHSLVPSNEKKNVTSSLNRMIVDILPWGQNSRWKELFSLIQKSIEKQKILKISYITADGVTSSREIEPMTLIFKSYTWYLWGYCLNRSDYRMFKLTRIKDFEETSKGFLHRGENYTEPKSFTTDLVKLKYKSTMDFLGKAMDRFGEENVTTVGDEVFIDIDFPAGEWVKELTLSLGPNIEVLEPEWLRSEIIEDSKKILNLYKL